MFKFRKYKFLFNKKKTSTNFNQIKYWQSDG